MAEIQSPMLESEASQLARAAVDVQDATPGGAGPFDAAKLHLGKSDLAIEPDTTYAEISAQEADYDGYAAQTVVWGVPVTSADGTVEVLGTALVFTPTGDTTENAIYNLWLSNTGSTAWYFAGALVGGPFPMNSALDQLVVVFRYRPATQSLSVVIA